MDWVLIALLGVLSGLLHLLALAAWPHKERHTTPDPWDDRKDEETK